MANTQQGLQMKYFVLNPTKDNVYGNASRIAIKAYAEYILKYNMILADDLRKWLERIRDEFEEKEGI